MRMNRLDQSLSSFFKIYIYLFMVVLGHRCCAPTLFSCSKLGPLFIVVGRLLIVVASFIVEHRL